MLRKTTGLGFASCRADRLGAHLELRPNCEYCDEDLRRMRRSPHQDAFCVLRRDRAVQCLPEFAAAVRARRSPAVEQASWTCLAKRPPHASACISYDREAVARFAKKVRDIPPESR